MSRYSRKHYRDIGALLGKSKASKKDVDSWVKRFKKDNKLFRPKQFRDYVKANRPRTVKELNREFQRRLKKRQSKRKKKR